MKKFAAMILAMILCVSCVSALAESTYTLRYSADEIVQNTFHNGFVTAVGCNEVNTLTLNDDGTYVYVKELHVEDEAGNVSEGTAEMPAAKITYTFYGAYTQDVDTVVLSFPTKVEFDENWGALAVAGYFLNNSGEATFEGEFAGDKVQCKEEEGHNPFDIFPGAFLNDALVMGEGFDAEANTVTVTLNGYSFEYVIHNSDDD